MTNTDKVLRYVQQHPGLDDDEISAATSVEPRQQVNIILRKLENGELVRRVKQPGVKIRNYPR